MQAAILPKGSRIEVTSYGPFRGLRGTIQEVNTIDTSIELEEPFCFYLVVLEGTILQEPMWFEHDEVMGRMASLVAHRSTVSG